MHSLPVSSSQILTRTSYLQGISSLCNQWRQYLMDDMAPTAAAIAAAISHVSCVTRPVSASKSSTANVVPLGSTPATQILLISLV